MGTSLSIIRIISRYIIVNRAGKIEKLDSWDTDPGDNGLMAEIKKLLKH